ncbi:hypothetical protein [Pseudomonas donghuensis]|uniref:Uncharacterized protein n=1 Tax=Pseudomonas donghuensis TaxID=1163398 RepID=A0AAQ0DPI9_9PSED|nr:hypothetical protein [Pseudomonas donghuensis]MCP6693645.1 hypothetical protein [Pseudomonas donghuensis]MDF9894128.1 hypothetical protein [Pseudomonas vranovensis]QWE81335.1 hypothetical protein BV82_16695 [Pseudomonas donghuensis]UVL27617.1 hypothetical protein LOY32_15495 [Pseudomonas donghuensis]
MSLDLYLEADKALTMFTLRQAMEHAGAFQINMAECGLDAAFSSGVRLTGDGAVTDPAIYAEDTKGIDFQVAMRCSIRIKGPEPDGQSAMQDLNKIAESIAQTCASLFLITFQFEETLYWRDATGLHSALREDATRHD